MILPIIGITVPFVLTQIPHLIIAIILISTLFNWKHKKNAEFIFHAVIGGIFLLVPQYIYKPTIVGDFDERHSFFQRFPSAIHIGLAFFYYLNKNDKTQNDASIQFAKALTGLLLVLLRFFFAFHLFDTRARGIHFSPNFLGCVLLVDGVWSVVEIIQLILKTRYLIVEEADVINKRTQRFLESKTNLIVNFLFWIDSAIGFITAILNFTYANDILKILVSREYPVDKFHALYTTEFACYALIPAIVSLFVVQFTTVHQLNYIRKRVLTQVIIIALKAYGFYSFQHSTTASAILIVFSFSHLFLLICIARHICVESGQNFFNFKNNVNNTFVSSNSTTTVISKKTTKVN